ncbi:ATP12 family chaperone protein [Novosphingobium lentum]|uniref:ATP12 family chaperone protein n=1 Tax=Novosphingobium lentum TaxID=145287 RepID=UPI0008317FD4|nr:ATP12 family protein [Novosphingobium lentum]
MKRFYREAGVAEAFGGWQVTLDGRAIKTVSARPQRLPTRALAEALAAEWADQGEQIDPARFVLRDFADFAIDVVAQDRAETIGALLAYGETDTLCYRAEPDEPLAVRQRAVWEPLLTAAETGLGVEFVRVAGILHRPQPDATLSALRTVLEGLSDFDLAALRTSANLAASLVIGLASLDPQADAAALWDAANLEEDWQAELWGWDAEAQARRAHRLAIFTAAARFAGLARP